MLSQIFSKWKKRPRKMKTKNLMFRHETAVRSAILMIWQFLDKLQFPAFSHFCSLFRSSWSMLDIMLADAESRSDLEGCLMAIREQCNLLLCLGFRDQEASIAVSEQTWPDLLTHNLIAYNQVQTSKPILWPTMMSKLVNSFHNP